MALTPGCRACQLFILNICAMVGTAPYRYGWWYAGANGFIDGRGVWPAICALAAAAERPTASTAADKVVAQVRAARQRAGAGKLIRAPHVLTLAQPPGGGAK